jgi:NADH-quinone oxidoreductase subunit J
MPELLFYLFAGLSVLSALGMLFHVRNTVAAAMCLVVTMISLGAIFALLEAYFVAVIQILVYAGAILVLFLFVVMLLNLRRDVFAPTRLRSIRILGVAIGLLVGVQLLALLGPALPAPAAIPPEFGGYRQVGRALFTDYLLAFETSSMLLLAAMVGAVVLAKRRID